MIFQQLLKFPYYKLHEKLKMFYKIIFFNLITVLSIPVQYSQPYLLFPRATFLQFTYGLSAPLILPRRSINFSLCLQVNYDLPYNLTKLHLKEIQAREGNEFDLNRKTFYNLFIDFLDSFDLDGEQCLLRSICEIAEYEMDLNGKENLLEEIVHFIFTPSLEFSGNSSFILKLLSAENDGKNNLRCKEKYALCDISIVDLFTAKYMA